MRSLAPPVPVARDGPPGYRRREPENTLLHRTMRAHLETFLQAARDRSAHGRGLPASVERQLRAYLDCGILARGFARVRCSDCGFERLVAFSCKARICPSCNARRMEDTAEHLVRNVFPQVPVRQWVLSMPRQVRFLAARDPKLCSRLLEVFTRTVFAWQRRRARSLGAADPRTAGSTAVQRFGGALNLNVHFHTLVPDGVFELPPEGRATFLPLSGPGPEELELLLRRIVRRVAKVLAKAGEAADEEDALAALQAAEVDRRPRYPERFEQGRRSAYVDGFSLHAGVLVHANDRQGLERLCRYLARPPFAVERLSELPDGRLAYRMKRPRGGSLWLVLTPAELIAKLATLVPPPGTHATRYHGLFAPNAKGRARVVPVPASPSAPGPLTPSSGAAERPRSRGAVLTPPAPEPPTGDLCRPEKKAARPYRIPWAELLKKVFAVDVLECPHCHGRLKVIAYLAEGEAAAEVLKHLGLDATGPPVAKAAPAPEPDSDPAPEYDGVDPVHEE